MILATDIYLLSFRNNNSAKTVLLTAGGLNLSVIVTGQEELKTSDAVAVNDHPS